MAYALDPAVPLGEAVADVVAAEVEGALISLALVHAGPNPGAVHDVRKRTKKLRAIALALSGSVPRRGWRAAYRAAGQAARTLANSRDAQVRLTTLTSLVADRQAAFADALAHAAAMAQSPTPRTPTSADEGTDDERVQHASWLLTGVEAEVATWVVRDRFGALAGGLGDTYRDGRRRWKALSTPLTAGTAPDVEALHRWRRAVKHRWYHTRLLQPVAPDLLGAESALLDELGELLGADHDLAVLADAMVGEPDPWGGAATVAEVADLAAQRQVDLRERALDLGRQLYALRTSAHVDRLGRWWEQARSAAGERTPR